MVIGRWSLVATSHYILGIWHGGRGCTLCGRDDRTVPLYFLLTITRQLEGMDENLLFCILWRGWICCDINSNFDDANRCEKALMGWVTVRNCVRLYTTADEIGAETLRDHCSTLISTHWVSIHHAHHNLVLWQAVPLSFYQLPNFKGVSRYHKNLIEWKLIFYSYFCKLQLQLFFFFFSSGNSMSLLTSLISIALPLFFIPLILKAE